MGIPGKMNFNMRLLCAFAVAVACVLVAACASNPTYDEGRKLVDQGRTEEGLEKLRLAAQKNPTNAEYRVSYLSTRDRLIATWTSQAHDALLRGDSEAAATLYRRILSVDPDNVVGRNGLERIAIAARHVEILKAAEMAYRSGEIETAQNKLHTVLIEDPNNPAARALKQAIEADGERPNAASKLLPTLRKPISLEFRDAPLKSIFEVLSRTAGINFVFDKDVKGDQKATIFLRNSTVEVAINTLLLTNQLEQRILDGNTLLIYPNTQAKVREYQQLTVRSFFLSNADVKQVSNSLKTILKTKDIFVDEKLNMLIVRDTPEAIRLAEKLVALHDMVDSEVMLELEVLELNRSLLQSLGIKWPTQLALTALPSTTGGSLTLSDLRRLSSPQVGATLDALDVNAQRNDAISNLLANPRIRARNHEKARILIGQRVPNITSTSTATGFVSQSITYIDVGLKLEIEPTIYLDNEVAIKVSLEVSSIVSSIPTSTGTLAYVIGTRTASTVLRLKDGENQVLAGLINDNETRSTDKIPLLGDIPLLGRLFGSRQDNNTKTEIVLSITPRIIRNIQRPTLQVAEFDAGTEARSRSGDGGSAASSPNTPVSSGASASSATASANAAGQNPAPGTSAVTGGTTIGGTSSVTGSPTVIGSGATVGGTGTPTSTGTLFNWQGPTQAHIGDSFAVQLNVQTDSSISTMALSIGFDPNVMQVTQVTEGNFMTQNNTQTNFSQHSDSSGQVTVSDIRAGSVGATGGGGVVTLTMKALAASAGSTIQLLVSSPQGPGGTAITAPLPLPLTVQITP